jgi:hypothetical protein
MQKWHATFVEHDGRLWSNITPSWGVRTMADLMIELDSIANCLLAVRIDAVGDQWHITERAVPSLLALADHSDEPRFRAAADAATVAASHLTQARDALRKASRLVVGDETSAQGSQP